MAELNAGAIARLRVRFGNRIRQVRTQKNMTQVELSEKSGICQASISLFEAGEKEPKLGSVFKLAAGLNVDAGSLLEDPGTDIDGKGRGRFT